MKRNKKYWDKIILGIIIFIAICLYQVYISYNNLTLNNYIINTKKLNDNIKIVILSDLHENVFGDNNEKLINKVKEQSPDIILVAGDMVNDNSKDSNVVINLMKELTKDAKVFYSLGNSEEDYIKANTSNLIKELEEVDVTVLNNEYKDIKIDETVIRIGGMYGYAFGENTETKEFLPDFQNTSNYKIIMAHRPDSFIFGDASKKWDIDLVVSGHTHGGQVVLPFLGGLYVGDQGWFPQYTKGLYDLNKMKMIITSGLGANKEKLPRFNNVPEVVNLNINTE
ncbi:metallophosphoesterase [Clostridium sp.]|uniref:metallophosphoesterase n=1 Tax=Clostridium sp. TaxID=1506 RepID=UPI002FC99475